MKIVIVDYGVGNLTSIKNMLKRIGTESQISSNEKDVSSAQKLILPGVGHFDYGMKQLKQSGLINVLEERVLQRKVPILGICLGVQLFTASSEEGSEPGLNWIKGKTIAFEKDAMKVSERVPHMGWADVTPEKESLLFEKMYDDPRFYFVHSFHLQLQNPSDALLTASYGYKFTAGIEHENILGVQFHPEKSHKYGMKLLENFVNNY